VWNLCVVEDYDPLHLFKQSSREPALYRFYFNRIARGHSYNRHPGGNTPARAGHGETAGDENLLLKQRAPDFNSAARVGGRK
jgi:hypothetical protein